MQKVGFIGWRGMVGQAFLGCADTHDTLKCITPYFFSTSQAGQQATIQGQTHTLLDAYALEALLAMDVLVSLQGSHYTNTIYPQLKAQQWPGFWLDASSYLRHQPQTTLVLDPINHDSIEKALQQNKHTFVGANCTVSLMLLALAGILDHITWVQASTYQAISGAGAKAYQALLHDHQHYPDHTPPSLAYNLYPWIDGIAHNGFTGEEQKAHDELKGLLQAPFTVASTCVRVPILRCHSQDLMIQLKNPMTLDTLERQLKQAHPWIRFVDNDPTQTLTQLTPIAVEHTDHIAIGRLRQSPLDARIIHLFTVGDQLLWGAALPIARMLKRLVIGTF